MTLQINLGALDFWRLYGAIQIFSVVFCLLNFSKLSIGLRVSQQWLNSGRTCPLMKQHPVVLPEWTTPVFWKIDTQAEGYTDVWMPLHDLVMFCIVFKSQMLNKVVVLPRCLAVLPHTSHAASLTLGELEKLCTWPSVSSGVISVNYLSVAPRTIISP